MEKTATTQKRFLKELNSQLKTLQSELVEANKVEGKEKMNTYKLKSKKIRHGLNGLEEKMKMIKQ